MSYKKGIFYFKDPFSTEKTIRVHLHVKIYFNFKNGPDEVIKSSAFEHTEDEI